MIKRIFRWRHWRARAKFWRHRALKAEASLEAECARNRAREDELITVPMRAMGLWGMPARDALAQPVKQVNASPSRALTTSDPWDTLTGADKMEFDLEWKDAGEALGLSLMQSRQQFYREVILPRRALNDEPFGASN
jgi:hypothetical protein